MKYKLAGGNVAVVDYEICSSVLQENGLSVSEAIRNLFAYIARTHEVPAGVREGANGATAARMAAFEELNDLIETSTPNETWAGGDDRDSVRDMLESRYV